MDTSLDALYASRLAATSQSAPTAAAAAAAKTETESGATFASLLAALSGGSDTNQTQQYLLNGLMDGSIDAGSGGGLASALLGTLDGSGANSSSLNSLLGYDALNSGAAGGLSADIMKSLLDLNQNMQTSQLEQLMKTLSSNSAGESEEDGSSLQAYYQALAAVAQAQQGLSDTE